MFFEILDEALASPRVDELVAERPAPGAWPSVCGTLTPPTSPPPGTLLQHRGRQQSLRAAKRRKSFTEAAPVWRRQSATDAAAVELSYPWACGVAIVSVEWGVESVGAVIHHHAERQIDRKG